MSQYPCYDYDNETKQFKCKVCAEFLAFDLDKTKQAFTHYFDSSLGIDFSSLKMPREFRNAKSVLKTHVATKIHTEATHWKSESNNKKLAEEKLSKDAGMTCGRLTYADFKRGRPASDYTCNVLVAAKNGSQVGDINHSKRFPPIFRENCAAVLTSRLKKRLDTVSLCSGQTMIALAGG